MAGTHAPRLGAAMGPLSRQPWSNEPTFKIIHELEFGDDIRDLQRNPRFFFDFSMFLHVSFMTCDGCLEENPGESVMAEADAALEAESVPWRRAGPLVPEKDVENDKHHGETGGWEQVVTC